MKIIIALFVRLCIRNDEVDTFLEFALIFVRNLTRNFLNIHDGHEPLQLKEFYQKNSYNNEIVQVLN